MSEQQPLRGRVKELESAVPQLRSALAQQKEDYEQRLEQMQMEQSRREALWKQMLIDAEMFGENRHLHPDKSFQDWVRMRMQELGL